MLRSLDSFGGLLVAAAIAGCGSSAATPAPDAAGGAGQQRPYQLVVPAGYDAAHPTPLVVMLHGYTSSGVAEDGYLGWSRLAQQDSFLLALPDGTKDTTGSRFWNATDACCNFYGSTVDDVG